MVTGTGVRLDDIWDCRASMFNPRHFHWYAPTLRNRSHARLSRLTKKYKLVPAATLWNWDGNRGLTRSNDSRTGEFTTIMSRSAAGCLSRGPESTTTALRTFPFWTRSKANLIGLLHWDTSAKTLLSQPIRRW